jgi:Bacterial archaeo-eukaryotic release factor family 10
MTPQKTIDRILRLDRDGLPVVSLYVAVDPDGSTHTRVNSLLDQIRPLAKDQDHALEHDARLSIRGDLERIIEASTEERWKQGTTAVFSCSGRDFFEEVSLPRTVRDRIVVDTTPWVRPMLAILDEYHRMCVVVVDEASAAVWQLYLNEIQQVRRLRDPALRNPNFADGKQEHKVHHKAEELTKRHYRRVATMLDDLCRAEGFDLLAVGGHPYQVSAFTEVLLRPLQERLAGTFNIDARAATSTDVCRAAQSIMDRYERDEERRLVAEIVEAVAERRRAALGLDDCLWAGTLAAIDRLAVLEGVSMPGVVCDRSGWLALSGETCPLCGEPTRTTGDVIDDLVEAVINDGGSVEHVATDTYLRPHVAGALLRFPLLPRPPT